MVARGSFRDPATLLLAGVAMAALFSASQTYALQTLGEIFGAKAVDDPVSLLTR